MSDFKTGDKVKDREGTEYTVEDGPQTCYKIRAAGDESRWLPASSLSPVPPEDPRLPVLAAAMEARDTGVAVSYWDLAVAAVAALDAAPSRVRDLDGDYHTMGSDGLYRMEPVDPRCMGRSYADLNARYGPLTPQ